ncbi:MAG TPA: thiamine phosphate synthase, partial [Actinomycetota bacterium]|nr:thiamine phosphate synthase [Actinomycetota bacterium]
MALLYLITPCVPGPLTLQELLMQVLPAGVDLVQIRDKDANRRQVEKVTSQILPLIRESGALLIVNDHVEVASAVGADGVHLGQEDMPVAQARRLLPAGG